MEMENAQQQVNSEGSLHQNPPSGNPIANQKGNLLLIIGVVVLVLVVGVDAYYLGVNKDKSSTNVNNQQVAPSINPTQTSLNPATNIYKNIDKITYLKDGDIFVFDLKTNQEKKLTNYGYNTSPVLSPDNYKIAYLSIPEAVVKSGKVQKFPGSGLFDQPISYEREYNVWIINTDGTNPIQVTKNTKKRKSIGWSADSNKISFEEDGQIIEYDLVSKKSLPLGEGTNPIYSPKGNGRAYVSDNEKTLQVSNNKGGQAYTHWQSINDLDWSDKDKIFFTSVSKTNGPTIEWKFSVWVYPMDGKPHQITQEKDGIHSPSVSPNESYIAVSQGSGYADAGNMDLSFVLLKMNNDLTIAKQLKLEKFKGPDFFEKEKQYMFPSDTPIWLNDKEVLVMLDELGVRVQPNPIGIYKLNVETLTAERLLELQ